MPGCICGCICCCIAIVASSTGAGMGGVISVICCVSSDCSSLSSSGVTKSSKVCVAT